MAGSKGLRYIQKQSTCGWSFAFLHARLCSILTAQFEGGGSFQRG